MRVLRREYNAPPGLVRTLQSLPGLLVRAPLSSRIRDMHGTFQGLAADKDSFSSDNLATALRGSTGPWGFLIGALLFFGLSKCCTLFFDKY
jgi:hypothetical protein